MGWDKVLPLVTHKASGRLGHEICRERRWRIEGVWVTWLEYPRPSWHPARMIVRLER
jgi:hypothetical protein